MTTIYEHDRKTNLWVRVERSVAAPAGTIIRHEIITCESKCTNFRRFVPTAKIK